MAASQLLAIYAAIAAHEVEVDGATIPCLSLEESTGVIHNPPCRILSPLSERNEGAGFEPLSFGGAATIQWIVTDLCLMAGENEGSSLEYWMPKIVQYMAVYIEDIFSVAKKHLGLGSSVIVNTVKPEIGVFNYPLGSDNWYYGIKMVWTVRENFV